MLCHPMLALGSHDACCMWHECMAGGLHGRRPQIKFRKVSGHKRIRTEIVLRQIGTGRLPDWKRNVPTRWSVRRMGRRLVHRHNAWVTPKLRAAARSAPEAPLLQPPPRRKGDYSSGNIDIAAAKDIKPTVTAEFSRYGLLPPPTEAVRSDFPTGGPAFGRSRKPD